MKEFRIDEISGVDSPAQQGASVLIMKRSEPTKEPQKIDPTELAKLIAKQLLPKEGDSTMSEKKGNDDLAKAQEAAQAAEAKAERLEAIIAMPADVRKHFDGLEGEAADDFLKATTEARAKIVEKAQKAEADADPVVYTTSEGHEIRKSAGAAFIAMAKSNDALVKRNAALEAEREQERLEKRADEELGFLPGTVQTRAAMLKAIEAIPDEEQRGLAMETLKSQNESMSHAFTAQGHLRQPQGDADPVEKLDTLAKEYSKTNSVPYGKAYQEVLATAEGKHLYEQSVMN